MYYLAPTSRSAVVAVLLVVCSACAPKSSFSPSTTSLPLIRDLSIPLTIGELIPPSPAASEVAWVAREQEIQECMKTKGFQYVPRPSPGYSSAWLQHRNMLVLSVNRAKTFGYRYVAQKKSEEEIAAGKKLDGLNANSAYVKAYGSQNSKDLGCYIIAFEKIDKPLQDIIDQYSQSIAQAQQIVATTTQNKQELQRVLEQWRKYMSAAGFRYSNLGDPVTDSRWANGVAPTPEEIITATVDAKCRTKFRVNEILLSSMRAAVQQWIVAHQAEVTEMENAEKLFTSKALALIEGRQ